MTGLIGAILASLMFYAGGLFATGDYGAGLTLAALTSIAGGTLFAAAKGTPRGPRFDTREGLSLDQLFRFLKETPNLQGDTKVYVGDQGLNVAGSVFSCILDGHRTVVIERAAVPGTPAAVPHDLF